MVGDISPYIVGLQRFNHGALGSALGDLSLDSQDRAGDQVCGVEI